MELPVFLAVLAAAALHAAWNSVIKNGGDKESAVLLLSLVHGAFALPSIVVVPLPDPISYPWLAASALLHTGYQLFLVKAYSHGDLSQTYPLARGTAPLIVTAVSVTVLGVVLAPAQLTGALLISAGILTMALLGGDTVNRLRGRALAWALGTAGFTAAYTLADGIGARLSGSATGYLMWMFLLNAFGMVLWSLFTRGPAAFLVLRPMLSVGVSAGALSLASYWIAIWAFTQAPIALVAALRETSILFALLIAVFWLREPVNRWRWMSAGLVVAGIVAMRL